MNAHVPDIDRCRKLKDAGFPQEETCFMWVCLGESWIIDLWKDDDLERYAAPIVTELVANLPASINGDGLHLYFISYGAKPNRWGATYLNRPDYLHMADTLPNALADLWLWARKEGA